MTNKLCHFRTGPFSSVCNMRYVYDLGGGGGMRAAAILSLVLCAVVVCIKCTVMYICTLLMTNESLGW